MRAKKYILKCHMMIVALAVPVILIIITTVYDIPTTPVINNKIFDNKNDKNQFKLCQSKGKRKNR